MPLRFHKIFFAIGLASIGTLVMYAIYRIIYSFKSLSQTDDYFTNATVILFLLAELFILIQSVGYFFNILFSISKYDRPLIHYSDEERMPTVDVLIPVHDEPFEVVFKTIVAAQHIDYEPYRIILIDDSELPESRRQMNKLCVERGVDYFLVPFPRHGAKAGAINEYLKILRAPYIAIFDADYRASRDFLKLIVPQLEADKNLAFIQTPQFYGNLGDIPISKAAQMQQSIFYEYICEGKSLKSATFMCGTNLVIRTEALRSVGGFDEGSITEDFATSLKMLLKGWKTKYFNETTAFGDGPLNIRQYFKQQYRWARGTIGFFLTSFWKILCSKNLSFGQRVEFILSGSYYIVGLVWLILLMMPLIYIFLEIPAYMTDPVYYFWAYLPYFLFSLFLFFQTLIMRHYRLGDWLKNQSLTLLTAPVYARATFHAFIGKKAHFEKTKKDASPHEIPWDQLYFQLALILLSLGAIFFGAYKLVFTEAENPIALGVNLFWCFFHLTLLSYLLIYVFKNRPQKS